MFYHEDTLHTWPTGSYKIYKRKSNGILSSGLMGKVKDKLKSSSSSSSSSSDTDQDAKPAIEKPTVVTKPSVEKPGRQFNGITITLDDFLGPFWAFVWGWQNNSWSSLHRGRFFKNALINQICQFVQKPAHFTGHMSTNWLIWLTDTFLKKWPQVSFSIWLLGDFLGKYFILLNCHPIGQRDSLHAARQGPRLRHSVQRRRGVLQARNTLEISHLVHFMG